jgi:signal transduction histidine kinase
MLYRVVQEQINNIIKHAKANEVTVRIKRSNGQLLMTVIDNGIGFDTTKKSKGIGLRNINTRISYYSGTVSLNSSKGEGTSLIVYLPLNSN